MKDKILEIVKTYLQDGSIEVGTELEEQMDLVDFEELVLTVEEQIGVKYSDEDKDNIQTVADFVTILEGKENKGKVD